MLGQQQAMQHLKITNVLHLRFKNPIVCKGPYDHLENELP